MMLGARRLTIANRFSSQKFLLSTTSSLPPYFSPARVVEAAATIPTIPRLKATLMQHASDTYKGVGYIPFQESDRRTVAEGADTAILPLSSDAKLRSEYATHRETVRYGLLIEQMDLFATWLGYKHNQQPNIPMFTAGPAHHTIGVVTAVMEKLIIHSPWEPLRLDRDLLYHGYTTWVGKSSSEIIVHIVEAVPAHQQQQQHFRTVATARFVMVTLGSDCRCAPNVQLVMGDKEEKVRFHYGEARKKLRALGRLNSPLLAANAGVGEDAVGENISSSTTPMADCRYNMSFQCFPEQRNLHRKIFGGFLLRRGFEAAFNNVGNFVGQDIYPQFIHAADLQFERSVDIGSVLHLNSQISYTEGSFVHCRVEGRSTGETTTTPALSVLFNNYTFVVPEGIEIPRVVPTTREEEAHYFAAKMYHENLMMRM